MKKNEVINRELENLFSELEKMDLMSGCIPTPVELQTPKNQINYKGEQIRFPIAYKIYKRQGIYAHLMF